MYRRYTGFFRLRRIANRFPGAEIFGHLAAAAFYALKIRICFASKEYRRRLMIGGNIIRTAS